MSPNKDDPLYRVEIPRGTSTTASKLDEVPSLRVWSGDVELLARIVIALNGKKPTIGIEPRLAKAQTA